jgi:hypothetical protein
MYNHIFGLFSGNGWLENEDKEYPFWLNKPFWGNNPIPPVEFDSPGFLDMSRTQYGISTKALKNNRYLWNNAKLILNPDKRLWQPLDRNPLLGYLYSLDPTTRKSSVRPDTRSTIKAPIFQSANPALKRRSSSGTLSGQKVSRPRSLYVPTYPKKQTDLMNLPPPPPPPLHQPPTQIKQSSTLEKLPKKLLTKDKRQTKSKKTKLIQTKNPINQLKTVISAPVIHSSHPTFQPFFPPDADAPNILSPSSDVYVTPKIQPTNTILMSSPIQNPRRKSSGKKKNLFVSSNPQEISSPPISTSQALNYLPIVVQNPQSFIEQKSPIPKKLLKKKSISNLSIPISSKPSTTSLKSEESLIDYMDVDQYIADIKKKKTAIKNKIEKFPPNIQTHIQQLSPFTQLQSEQFQNMYNQSLILPPARQKFVQNLNFLNNSLNSSLKTLKPQSSFSGSESLKKRVKNEEEFKKMELHFNTLIGPLQDRQRKYDSFLKATQSNIKYATKNRDIKRKSVLRKSKIYTENLNDINSKSTFVTPIIGGKRNIENIDKYIPNRFLPSFETAKKQLYFADWNYKRDKSIKQPILTMEDIDFQKISSKKKYEDPIDIFGMEQNFKKFLDYSKSTDWSSQFEKELNDKKNQKIAKRLSRQNLIKTAPDFINILNNLEDEKNIQKGIDLSNELSKISSNIPSVDDIMNSLMSKKNIKKGFDISGQFKIPQKIAKRSPTNLENEISNPNPAPLKRLRRVKSVILPSQYNALGYIEDLKPLVPLPTVGFGGNYNVDVDEMMHDARSTSSSRTTSRSSSRRGSVKVKPLWDFSGIDFQTKFSPISNSPLPRSPINESNPPVSVKIPKKIIRNPSKSVTFIPIGGGGESKEKWMKRGGFQDEYFRRRNLKRINKNLNRLNNATSRQYSNFYTAIQNEKYF